MSNSPKIKLFSYNACGTCRKARKWLDDRGLEYRLIPIVDEPPSKEDLERWVEKSGLSARKWLNTSGQSYRALIAELGRERVRDFSEGEIIERLSQDGKLIKRPVLVTEDEVLVGFREEAYAKIDG